MLGSQPMKRERMHYPLKYRRARTVLFAVGLFWLWALFGSASFISGLGDSPVYAIIALYGVAVAILVSIPVAFLAVAGMLLDPPRAARDDVVHHLPLESAAQPPRSWHSRNVS